MEELGIGSPTRIELSYGRLSVNTYALPADHANSPPQPQWQTIWTSDPGWRVTGYSVGDANGDGKPDLTYILWKRQRPGGARPKVAYKSTLTGVTSCPTSSSTTGREARSIRYGTARPGPCRSYLPSLHP